MEWIPVSQTLPQPYVEVLLAFADHDSAVIGYQIEGEWFTIGASYNFRNEHFLSVPPADAPLFWAPIQSKLPDRSILSSNQGALKRCSNPIP